MMSDDMLSQDEIDALLRGTDDVERDEPKSTPAQIDDVLTSLEQDALGEIGNISFGSSATALSTLLNQKVDITTPTVSVVNRQNLADEFPQPYVSIQVEYTEGFSGANLLVIRTSDAQIIADLMMGGTGEDLSPEEEMNELQLSAVQEAMNQMMGSAATSMSTIFNKRVDISPPAIDILDVMEDAGTENLPMEEEFIRVSFRLKVGTLIDSSIMQLLPVAFAKQLVQELLNSETEDVDQGHPTTHKESEQKVPVAAGMLHETEQEAIPQGRSNGEGAYGSQSQYSEPRNAPQQTTNVQVAEFSSFQQNQPSQTEVRNLDMLLDIPLEVTVELGRTRRTVKDVLELSSGSIIELDKLAGEPVDILVNRKLIAKGEVVVIDENFGVRVTDIISQSDRIMKLK